MARDTRSYTSEPASGSGVATVPIRVQDGVNTWTVDQVSTSMDSAPVGSTCALVYNGRQVTPLIPTGDVADGDPSIRLRPSDTLAVVWSSVTPGSVGTVLIFYDDGRPA